MPDLLFWTVAIPTNAVCWRPHTTGRSNNVIIAEIGADMSVFPTAGHLASWARICPGNNITGGKRKSGTTGGGNRWLREVLVECA